MRSSTGARLVRVALWTLLAICMFRFWIMPLPSSFWVDEAGTMFVVRQGAHHPSLTVAPQVPASVYFWLPRLSDRLLRLLPRAPGVTETVYRLPSVLCLALAVLLIGRIAGRLIHPRATWFAVFACFALRSFNYEADDARPYALGILVVSAAVYLLVRWLDSGKNVDAALFVLAAALIWRVHLVYWPIYSVLFVYAFFRVARSQTPVSWGRALAILGIAGITLLPVLSNALALFRQAGAHVIAPVPPPKELIRALKFGLLLESLGIALILCLAARRFRVYKPAFGSMLLVAGWWLIPPVAIFGFSWITGNSVFVNRYLSFGLPGIALAATAVAAALLPERSWDWAAGMLALGVLIVLGNWTTPFPPHHNSNWRAAAEAVNELPYGLDVPVICPSPFIEARPPVWSPVYALPGFLYSQLVPYPVRGKLYLFPFEKAPGGAEYAAELSRTVLLAAGRFILYGSAASVRYWRKSFEKEPEYHRWTDHPLGDFGDVSAVEFDRQ